MAENLPKRKTPRLSKFDYSTPGTYFITICTKDKKQILSDIVGAIHHHLHHGGLPKNDILEGNTPTILPYRNPATLLP